jgi:hypothetical protein
VLLLEGMLLQVLLLQGSLLQQGMPQVLPQQGRLLGLLLGSLQWLQRGRLLLVLRR